MFTIAAVKLINAKHILAAKISNRDGMEMLQLVILIAIAITLGGIVFFFLQTYFQGNFWDAFTNKMQDIFDGKGQG